jgi:lipoprotein-anchoring transpeptidase ErfK/SrfK
MFTHRSLASGRGRRIVPAAAVTFAVLAGCGRDGGQRPAADDGVTRQRPPGTAPADRAAGGAAAGLPAGWSLVAQAAAAEVKVFDAPGRPGPVWTLASPNPRGVPLVFLVRQTRPGWLLVDVPVRPNGSTGWVRAADVRVTSTAYSLLVDRKAHLLTVYRDGRPTMRVPVGIGTGQTPTPTGHFYLAELIRTTDPDGAWGPYAYGLSGFSDVVRQFNGADGIIGLHGTNRPDLVGSDVSLGCIRLRNADILALVEILPLGTPISIIG